MARVVVNVMPKAEILDPQGQAIVGALGRLGHAGVSDVRQGKRFELQVQEADGSWRTVHAGSVFGTIYAKRFAPVSARHVRLNIAAPVRQFDLFGENTRHP